MSQFKHIYFVGIKGVGMASLAVVAKEAGFDVRGSDVEEEFITDKILHDKGIEIDKGFNVEDIEAFVGQDPTHTLVIVTAAHDGLSNPQSTYALEQNMEVLTHGQAVGSFMKGALFERTIKGISILGTHGKTTITAMCATALTEAGLNPTYTVGTSELFPVGPGGHFGTGEYFIAEADEFISDVKKDRTVKFLYQHPDYAIINNIDFDHPDVYEDLADVEKKFLKFCQENINTDGTLILNGDDEQVLRVKSQVVISRADLHVITYGEHEENDIRIINFKEEGWGSTFEVLLQGSSLGEFNLSVPGFYNAKNALSVIALLNELGTPLDVIKKGITAFKGTKRRQEQVGTTKHGALVIDDYAHHPEEIEKTLGAIKNAYSTKKIVAVFQPHTLSRTESLWKEFAAAFKDADEVLFLPIFTSKREGDQDYARLYDSIKKTMRENGTKVQFLETNMSSVVEYIQQNFNTQEFVLVTLGAGDLYKIGYDLISKHA